MKKITTILFITTLFFAGCKRETIVITHTPKPQREVANNLVGTWELYQKQLYSDTTQYITDFEILDTIIFRKDSVLLKNVDYSPWKIFTPYCLFKDVIIFNDINEKFVYERIGQDSIKISAMTEYFYNSFIHSGTYKYRSRGIMYFQRIER